MSEMERAKELLEQGCLEECCRLLTTIIDDGRTAGEPERVSELSEAYNTRGHIRYLWVDFDRAVSDYTEAIGLDPGFAVAYYNRGQVHYRLGRYSLAERDLRRAVELSPQFTDAQLNLEQVREDMRRGHTFNTADQFREDS